MWISNEEAQKYNLYRANVARVPREKIVYTDCMACVSLDKWREIQGLIARAKAMDLTIKAVRASADDAVEIARAEAEEWKHKYADEFQKRMALLNQMIEDNSDEDVHTGYHPEHEW